MDNVKLNNLLTEAGKKGLKVIREVDDGYSNFKVLLEVKHHKTLVIFNNTQYVVFAKNNFNDSFFWGKYYGGDLEGALNKFTTWDI